MTLSQIMSGLPGYWTRSQGTARQRAMKDKKTKTNDTKSIQETMVDAWKEKTSDKMIETIWMFPKIVLPPNHPS